MPLRNVAAIAVLALVLSGCVESIAVLKNPTTGEMQQCRAGGGPTLFPLIQSSIDHSTVEDCARGYVTAGWVRMN